MFVVCGGLTQGRNVQQCERALSDKVCRRSIDRHASRSTAVKRPRTFLVYTRCIGSLFGCRETLCGLDSRLVLSSGTQLFLTVAGSRENVLKLTRITVIVDIILFITSIIIIIIYDYDFDLGQNPI